MDNGLLLPDSLVFTHESEEDEIFGGDPKPNPRSDHSFYCVPLLSNRTKGNQNLHHRIVVTSELILSRFIFVCFFLVVVIVYLITNLLLHDSQHLKRP